MTPQEVYEAKKLARLNELSLKYTGQPYSAPGEPKVKATKAPSATPAKRPTLTKEQRKARKDRAVELLRQGELTQREIAEEIGVTQTTVCAWAHEVGIKKRRLPKYRWSERSRQLQSERMRAIQAPESQRVQRFIELYESGAYVADIAQELCIVRGTVYDWVQRYKPNKQARYKTTNKQVIKKITVTYDNDERVRHVVELYEAGVHRDLISQEVSVSPSTVYQWARRYADKTQRKQAKKQARSSAYKKVSHDTDKS
jgi:transposase